MKDIISVLTDPEMVREFNTEARKRALHVGTVPPFYFVISGYGSCEEISKIFYSLESKDSNCRLIAKSYRVKSLTQTTQETWKIKFGIVDISYNFMDEHIRIELVCLDEQSVSDLIKQLGALVSSRPPCSRAMVLVNTQCGMELHSIGTIDSPLSRTNYGKQTLDDYDHIISCLSSKDPCGHFILLTGPPGTGKSYIIRALATQTDALFVLVPASLAGSLTGPTIMPVLIENKVEGKPIILIIEDSDACISKEARHTNPDGLADILNLGDGLFGQLVDVRIVATSNADRFNLDPAITRPGRMCRHLCLENLKKAEAEKAFKEITGQSGLDRIKSNMTLAEIYRLARLDGWEPDNTKPFRAGDYR